MNGKGQPYRRMRRLAATLAILAALTGAAAVAQTGAPLAAIVEIVPLEKDHWVLVLPGGANEKPLQVEITKGMPSGWESSGPGLTTSETARWRQAWQQVLGTNVQEASLWPEALRRIGDTSLPPGVVLVEPDLHLILRSSGEDPKYLSLVENHAIRQGSAGWEKVGDIDVDRALSIPAQNPAKQDIWNLVFKQDPPASNAWPLFWNSWIDSSRQDPGKHLLIYRGAGGKLVHVARERIEEARWQQLVAGSDTPPVGTTSSTTTSSSTSSSQPDDAGWQSYLPYLGILALILAALAVLASLRYRAQIKRRILIWLVKLLSPQDSPSLPELIERLHTAAQESLSHDLMPAPELDVRPQALAFVRKRFLAIAEAGTVVLPVLQLPQVDDKEATRQQEEAALGRELLDALKKRSDEMAAREFLTFLLGLERQLASEKRAIGKLQEEKRTLEEDYETLERQIKEEQRKFNEQKTRYENLKTENNTLKNAKNDLDKMQDKSRAWTTEKGNLEAALQASQQQYDQLNTQLTRVTGERNSFERSANDLQAQIERERREQETARNDKKALDEKLIRVSQASDYLRKTHLAYWDRASG